MEPIHSLSQIVSGKRRSVPTGPKYCQKCLGTGHWTFQCKGERPYLYRPSRSKQMGKVKKITQVPQARLEDRKGLADDILKKRKKEESSSESE